MKHDRFGFNNFKSFGEREQMFSDKPMTLIYGANSIGKSSFLHAQILREYLSETGDINFSKSDFAGDPLDLGGFKNFIHGKDESKSINYVYEINNQNSISGILGEEYIQAQKYSDHPLINKSLQQWSSLGGTEEIDDIVKDRLTNLRAKEDVFLMSAMDKRKLKYFRSLYWHPASEKREEVILLLENKFYLYNDKNLKNLIDERKNILESVIIDTSTFCDNVERVDGTDLDEVDNLILYLMDFSSHYLSLFSQDSERANEDAIRLWHTLHKFSLLSQIKTITVKSEHPFQEVKKSTNNIFFSVDHQLIFEAMLQRSGFYQVVLTGAGKTLLTNLALDYKELDADLPLTFAIPQTIGVIPDLLRFHSILDSVVGGGSFNSFCGATNVHNYLQLFLGSAINLLSKNTSNTIQYFGPLRFYPKKSDLMTLESVAEIESTEEDERNVKNDIKLHFWLMKYISLQNKLRFLPDKLKRAILIGLFWPIGAMVILLNYDKFAILRDASNKFRKVQHRRSSKSALRTEKIWNKLILSKKLREEVNHWLSDKDKLKTTYKIESNEYDEKSWLRKTLFLKPNRYTEIRFLDQRTGVLVTPREMGLGISQFLPILLASKTLTNATNFIEQPELHLHPTLQCEVADEFIRSMNTKNNKFYIETHSEHLLLRVMKRLRHSSEGLLKKGDELYLTPNDVCLLYVDNNGSFTYLNELELNEDGSLLDPWPNGFFEEGLNERFT